MPGCADQADPGTLLDRLSSDHVHLREMSIERADLMTVIDNNRPAVAATPSNEGHGAARWRVNKCAPAGADVYAGVKSRLGCARRAEAGTDRAVHRPSDPQRRKRLRATVWSREMPRRCATGHGLGEAVAAGREPPVAGRHPGRLRAHDQDHGHGHYRPHREATHFQPSRAPQLSQSLCEKLPMPVFTATALTVRWGTTSTLRVSSNQGPLAPRTSTPLGDDPESERSGSVPRQGMAWRDVRIRGGPARDPQLS